MTSTYAIRITPAVLAEYETREPEALVYGRIVDEGGHWHDVNAAEAWELLLDAEFYAEANEGPGGSLTAGQRTAYRRLAEQLRALNLDPDDAVAVPTRALTFTPRVEPEWVEVEARTVVDKPGTRCRIRRPDGSFGDSVYKVDREQFYADRFVEFAGVRVVAHLDDVVLAYLRPEEVGS